MVRKDTSNFDNICRYVTLIIYYHNNNIYLMFCGDVRIKEFGCENFNEEWNGRIKRYSLNR